MGFITLFTIMGFLLTDIRFKEILQVIFAIAMLVSVSLLNGYSLETVDEMPD